MLETLLAIARTAGDAVLELYGVGLTVDYKAYREPVTAADRRSNRLLVDRLNAAFPGIPVVAEESEPSAFIDFRSAEQMFFVDPLDGTREFIERNGEFVVMIGLVQGMSAVAGVVHAPTTGTAWAGAIGVGAWRIDQKTRHRIAMHVSATADLRVARVVASRSHRTPDLERTLSSLGAREVRPLGSAGLKGARVAEGLAEAYVETSAGTKRWDACAIDALVTAAGGRLSDLKGEPIDYRGATLVNERGLVVTNGRVHEAIIARIDVGHVWSENDGP
jgi:3'(2'), 5'-bisphosphate nucleotidase